MKAILFLGTSLVGAKYIRKAIEPFGLFPIFLVKLESYSGDSRYAIEACKHYEADVNLLDDILRVIKEHDLMADVIAVTSLLDETLHNACAVAEIFNINGPDPKLSNLIDKTKIQQIIPEVIPPSLTIDLSQFSEDQLVQFLNSNTSYEEFLLKPGISSGAVGISILNRPMTTHQIREEIQNSNIGGTNHQNWVLQARIFGRLYSLEGFVRNGGCFFLGFSRRVREALTESITEFPVDDELSVALQENCQKTVKMLVERSGYMNGYFHCEFIITRNNAYFIDGNMGRIAGGAIAQQIALVYGKNPEQIYRHVFDLGLFKETYTSGIKYKKITEKKTLSINYCLEHAAVVQGVTSPANMTCFHTQVASNNRITPTIGESDCAWVGFLAGFREKVLTEIELFTIHTNHGPVKPFYVLTERQSLVSSLQMMDTST